MAANGGWVRPGASNAQRGSGAKPDSTTARSSDVTSNSSKMRSAMAASAALSNFRCRAAAGPFVAGELQQVFQGPTAMFLAIGAAALVAAAAIGSLAADRRDSVDPIEASALHG